MPLPVIEASIAEDTAARIAAAAGCPYRTGVWAHNGEPVPEHLCAVTTAIVAPDRDEQGRVTGLRLNGDAIRYAKRSADDTLKQRVEDAELAVKEPIEDEPIKVGGRKP